ncbi:Zinc metalloproteinase nas-8 [Gryllus bimaculatus]|nr:Zinc metalloproteinase nas-8 [Gryllus bimaculatus]
MRVWVLILITSLLAIGSARKPAPPQPVFHGHFRSENQRLKIADKIAHWSKRDKTNPWELGGLYQGDIMEADNLDTRSGMENPGARWPGGIVPYYIQKGFFNGHQIRIIHSAINEFHKRTCIRFRPYKKGDSSFIVIKGQKGGCWSYIGRVSNRRKPGQQLINTILTNEGQQILMSGTITIALCIIVLLQCPKTSNQPLFLTTREPK